jgi:hypothetical protein
VISRGKETSLRVRIDTIPVALFSRSVVSRGEDPIILPKPEPVPDETSPTGGHSGSDGIGPPSTSSGGGGGTFGGGDRPANDPATKPASDPASDPAAEPVTPAPADPAPLIASTFTDDAIAEAARGTGQTALKDLDDAISSGAADSDRGAITAAGYARGPAKDTDIEDGPLADSSTSGKAEYLDLLNIKATTQEDWEVLSISNTPGGSPILSYAASLQQKSLIVKSAFISEDVNRAGVAPGEPVTNAAALKVRDMMMDGWRVKAGNPDTVKTLTSIVRDQIINEKTSASIDSAFKITGSDREGTVTFSPSTTDANELAAFQVIAGSPQGLGTIKMLTDHHQELGDLKVTSITALTNENDITGYYALVFNLGH